jgi:hypothetical protein
VLEASSVSHDFALPIECQHSIGAAVEEEQSALLVDRQAAWVRNMRVVAELTERSAIEFERKQGPKSVAIDTRGAGNEERHGGNAREQTQPALAREAATCAAEIPSRASP